MSFDCKGGFSNEMDTMTPLDVEKRTWDAAKEANNHLPASAKTPSRRQIVPWIAVLIAALTVLLIGSTSFSCDAVTSFVTSNGLSPAVITRSPVRNGQETPTTTASAGAPARTALKTFEVAQPVLMPDGPAESDGSTRHGKDYSPELCTVLLMRHDFAWSYEAPFVGKLDHGPIHVLR
jgi:hypothetical protein